MKITKVEFHHSPGSHVTLSHVSGNPGYTISAQYFVTFTFSDGSHASVNLKSDFSNIFQGKRITEKRRKAIEALIREKEPLLKNLTLDVEVRSGKFAQITHWQKTSRRESEPSSYLGFNEESLQKVGEVLFNGFLEIMG